MGQQNVGGRLLCLIEICQVKNWDLPRLSVIDNHTEPVMFWYLSHKPLFLQRGPIYNFGFMFMQTVHKFIGNCSLKNSENLKHYMYKFRIRIIKEYQTCKHAYKI